MKHTSHLPLNPAQKAKIRELAGKHPLNYIVAETGSTMHYVKDMFYNEGLEMYKKPKKGNCPNRHKPKRATIVYGRNLVPDKPKTPIIRPKAEYSNVRSLYNLD